MLIKICQKVIFLVFRKICQKIWIANKNSIELSNFFTAKERRLFYKVENHTSAPGLLSIKQGYPLFESDVGMTSLPSLDPPGHYFLFSSRATTQKQPPHFCPPHFCPHLCPPPHFSLARLTGPASLSPRGQSTEIISVFSIKNNDQPFG